MAEKVKFKQERWSLEDLFPGLGTPEIEAALDSMDESITRFEKLRADLDEGLDEERFLSILQMYELIERQISRLHGFASLKFSEDTQDQAAQTLRGRIQQKAAEMDNRTMFFKLWWKGLEQPAAERLLQVSDDYRYWLESLRLQKPYTLTEPEEKVINLKDVNGSNALVNLYATITNRYSFKLKVDGEFQELTREELQVNYRSPDPGLRAGAYQELYRVYGEDAPVLGQIYQYLVHDWRSEGVDMRGYASPIAIRNLANDVPDEVIDTMLAACRENAHLFHRFFALKARLLGVERLRRYDLYAPVVEADKRYPYGDAVTMVLESFDSFDPRLAGLARKIFDSRHIDSEVRKGKRSGAFCATIGPDLTPWVLQSYVGQARNITTMAHELGHAVHSLLADKHSALTQHASLPLAETASTFGEMLLIDRLLEVEDDAEVRRDILFQQMDDAYATIMRQAYFALFEREAHEQIHAGAEVDTLHEIYQANLQEQFGESLELSDDFRFEWTAIPHFYHTPFYVYAYSFGQLLVLALYQQYLQDGAAFKPRYFDILEAGGSASPEMVLKRAGIDIYAKTFWQGGFDVIAENLKQLEALKIED
ncbi:MAG: M3 family oligoendopeptidase [Anaerolineales bacterium]|nr:MAG: M3 family oligoendopeptidase [Anaerolineales bacterium]